MDFTVTLQAQHEYPKSQMKDKFLIQSTVVSSNTKVDELSSDTVRKTTVFASKDQYFKETVINALVWHAVW